MSSDLPNLFLDKKSVDSICAIDNIDDVMDPVLFILCIINLNNNTVNWLVVFFVFKAIVIILIPCIPAFYKITHCISWYWLVIVHIITMSFTTLSSTNLVGTMFHPL